MAGLLPDWERGKNENARVIVLLHSVCALVFGVVLKKRRRKRRETENGLVSIARQRFRSITIVVAQ